ncbi:hypothetical protein prwr041_19580 [Prevotella herbatica]|uniref:Lipoprotein n=2 Tax=Prevotella herbatica TaxID=2801997 RepID=A0ABN6EJG7_9BACT|nr:hypothetical protein prwr041_19580 [Prevotella herbatica]
MGNSIKLTYVFILLLLLGSCRKNRNVSEFVVDPPYETKVEYMEDTIKLTDIHPTGPTGEDNSYIWVKKNGKYYSDGFLIMSTEKDTSYIFPEINRVLPVKEVCVTRKISKNLYSNKTYLELAPHHWEMCYAVYYDKSYRIIKFQKTIAISFILKK